jgi:hypothetical protein
MLRKIFCSQTCFAAALVFCASAMVAQTSAPSPSSNPAPQQPQQMRRAGNGNPCWQQAGITKSVMEQRWEIERQTRTQVEAGCSNASLTPQQKKTQAQEIRESARIRVEGLVSPEQEKALTACQQERGMNHPGGGMGGCGGEWNHQGQRPNGSPNGAPGNGNGGSNPSSGSAPPPPPSQN